MRVKINKDTCVMCGSCVAICPEVFEMKDNGSVDVKAEFQNVDITDASLIEKVKQAQAACPTMAIETEE